MAYARQELPDDAPRATAMEQLGYTISNDKITDSENEELAYQFTEDRNDRFNEIKHEDYEEIGREIVEKRLIEEDIWKGYLPGKNGVSPTLEPTGDPQVPVYFSKFRIMPKQCERLVILVGKDNEAPHVHSRHLWDTDGVNMGSIVNFVQDAHARKKLGLIIANPGQNLWSKTLKKAVTSNTYLSLSRDKGTDEGFFQDTDNTIMPGNENPEAHLKTLFNELVLPTIKLNSNRPKVYIIAVNNSGRRVVKFLQESWAEYKNIVEALVVCAGDVSKDDFVDQDFYRFWHERCKSYWMDASSIDTPIESVMRLPNAFSAGISTSSENVLSATYNKIFDFFDKIHSDPGYKLQVYTKKSQPIQHVGGSLAGESGVESGKGIARASGTEAEADGVHKDTK